MEISTVSQRPLTVPLYSPNGRQLPAVRTVQGDCERVYSDELNSDLHFEFQPSHPRETEVDIFVFSVLLLDPWDDVQ